MAILGKHSITLVWLLLIVATCASWALGTDHASFSSDAAVVTVGIITIAMTKVRFVVHYFMEVRSAPIALRFIFEAWMLVLSGAMLGIYLLK